MIDGQGIRPDLELPWAIDLKEESYLNNVSDQLLKHR